MYIINSLMFIKADRIKNVFTNRNGQVEEIMCRYTVYLRVCL